MSKTSAKGRSPATEKPAAGAPVKQRPRIPPEQADKVFAQVGQNLREGLSAAAEKLLRDTIDQHRHTPDDLANLRRLLSFTLETLGRYKESLNILRPYEDEDTLAGLLPETQLRVMTQLGIAYNNLTDQPKAVTLLKLTLERAVEAAFGTGAIENGLSRVYRKLNECQIARGHAERALDAFRERGDWLGMAESYREIALSYQQESDFERAIQNYRLAVQIVGDRSAPFMLGRLYTEMSGAYWFLRRPKDGIECLERSVEFFDRTEHVLNSVIAYNNLGMNLFHVGEWVKAENMVRKALELASRSDHSHVAGILDTIGEMRILQGELAEAEQDLKRAVDLAREKKREWYEVQAMRNLARCYLAQGRRDEAIAAARETIELSGRMGDKHHAKMARLILAEAELDDPAACEDHLHEIEKEGADSDFALLGNAQRIRGLAALRVGDVQLALHHFNRSLTVFETADDVYHTALVHLLIGENLGDEDPPHAAGHLRAASDTFHRLGVIELAAAADNGLRAQKLPAVTEGRSGKRRPNSVVTQLLMVRLAEATASRELLFRELNAVLQQESRAKRLMIAEHDDSGTMVPFITHGYTPAESRDIVARLAASLEKGDEKALARAKNIAVIELNPSNARPAWLLVNPQSGAMLNDESPLQPLVRVVELGMDVIALREREKDQPVRRETSALASNTLMPGFIHSSPAMTELVEEVYKIRSSDVTVLVTGESGTGKELVSRAIHMLSSRKDKVFVPFNCTAVPKELAEGHLFGYKRGAFTGATADSPGMIRAADGGTLFLDEIGDLPIDVQPKLLRFLQEGEVQPVGEKRPIKVDVRVIAATNMPLEEKVAAGTFREDLYYRLNVIRLRVPPLRERRGEIPPIVNYYINHYSSRFQKHNITITPQTVDLLMVCEWEGNVRQLCNEIQRIIARADDGDVITPEHLSPELKRSARPLTALAEGGNVRPIASYGTSFSQFDPGPEATTLETAVGDLEMRMISASLNRHNWNISRVANELGLTRRGLYLKLARYGIEKSA